MDRTARPSLLRRMDWGVTSPWNFFPTPALRDSIPWFVGQDIGVLAALMELEVDMGAAGNRFIAAMKNGSPWIFHHPLNGANRKPHLWMSYPDNEELNAFAKAVFPCFGWSQEAPAADSILHIYG